MMLLQTWPKHIGFSGLLLVVLMVLAGCAASPKQPAIPADLAVQQRLLAALDHWTANGKVALRNADTQQSANLVWRQHNTESRLSLSGPFGAGTTQLFSDGRSLTVERGGEKRTFDVSSPDAIRLNTGWELPLQALPHWLKGLPDPSAQLQQLDIDPSTGRLRQLTQFDWEVLYKAFRTIQLPTGETLTLPSRVILTSKDTRATVLIRNWTVETH